MGTSGPQNILFDRKMKRNLFLLIGCQAIGQSANTMMFIATALSVVTFISDHGLATLPVTMQHLGVMLWVFPAALLMQRMGRRFGYQVGSVFGIIGATTCGVGLYYRLFPLMCLGRRDSGLRRRLPCKCTGSAPSSWCPSNYRAKAISWVTAGGVVAGIIGPAVAHERMTSLCRSILAPTPAWWSCTSSC